MGERGGGAGVRPREAAAAVVVAAVVVLVLAPVPPVVLDVLLAASFGGAAAMVAAALAVRSPAALGAFPSLVLLATLVRVGTVVAVSRGLLADGDGGAVATAFGAAVAGGSLLVGAVVFAVLAIFQFLVVARGAERVAEVAARFALDAMPGKQLAIDADLRAGAIDAAEAGRRRAALEREAQFYGAMDGAMKFVRGDAVAALLIVVVVTGAGLAVGLAVRGLPLDAAAARYALPALGAGLAAQVPALLVALAAALLVTRLAGAAEADGADGDAGAGALAPPPVLAAAAGLVAVLAVLPGMPALPFAAAAAGLGGLALAAQRRGGAGSRAAPGEAPVAVAAGRVDTEAAALAVAIGPGLQRALADAGARAALTAELDRLRQELFAQLGVVAPPLAVRADPALADRELAILLDGTAVAFAEAAGGEPAAAVREAADAALRRVAHELLTLDAVQARLDELARSQPAAVREVVPRLASLPVVAAVLRALAREQVSVRELAAVLEAVAAQPAPPAGFGAADVPALAERVRAALRRQLTAAHAPRGALAAYTVDGMIEDAVRGALVTRDGATVLALEPELAQDIVGAARAALPAGERCVVLASSDVRRHLRTLLEPELPDVAVLAPHELAAGVTVRAVGRIAV